MKTKKLDNNNPVVKSRPKLSVYVSDERSAGKEDKTY